MANNKEYYYSSIESSIKYNKFKIGTQNSTNQESQPMFDLRTPGNGGPLLK